MSFEVYVDDFGNCWNEAVAVKATNATVMFEEDKEDLRYASIADFISFIQEKNLDIKDPAILSHYYKWRLEKTGESGNPPTFSF